MKRSILLSLILVVPFCSLWADDAGPSSVESRLRAALQQTAQQLRDTQDQLVAAQAAQTQSDQDKTALQAKLDAANTQIAALAKQDADDKAAAASTADDFNARINDLNTALGTYKSSVAAGMKDDKANAQLAAVKEAARAQLAVQTIAMQRSLDDRERENVELYKLGNEILTRYQNFGLGDALAAKEPFIGTSRVKLQTLVQNYRDKLLDHVLTSGHPAAPASLPVAPASKSTATPPTVQAGPSRGATAANP